MASVGLLRMSKLSYSHTAYNKAATHEPVNGTDTGSELESLNRDRVTGVFVPMPATLLSYHQKYLYRNE